MRKMREKKPYKQQQEQQQLLSITYDRNETNLRCKSVYGALAVCLHFIALISTHILRVCVCERTVWRTKLQYVNCTEHSRTK